MSKLSFRRTAAVSALVVMVIGLGVVSYLAATRTERARRAVYGRLNEEFQSRGSFTQEDFRQHHRRIRDELGTNAIPMIIKELAAGGSVWQQVWARIDPNGASALLRFPARSRHAFALNAIQAFTPDEIDSHEAKLTQLLESRDPFVVDNGVTILWFIARRGALLDNQTADRLMRVAANPASHARTKAIGALSYHHSAAKIAVPKLASLIADPDPEIRKEALRALARLANDAGPVLAQVEAALSDPDPAVKAEARAALIRIHPAIK